MKKKRVVVLDVVGLRLEHFNDRERIPHLSALLDHGKLCSMKPVFPAVTLPVQASVTTGVYPEHHGVVANGFYFPETYQVAFWEQGAHLVQAERIWDRLKRSNPALTTAALFLQSTLYSTCDAVITPRPLHTDEGLVQWCYSKPAGLYEDISAQIGEFNLMHYWGPMASIESSRWIAKAAGEVMARLDPDLMFVYLPHLDYCSQRHGPDSPLTLKELFSVDAEVGRIIKGITDMGLYDRTTFLVFSEYAFSNVHSDIPLNKILRAHGLLKVRTIKGREYLDAELSPAFAMVDHQVAHIYIKPGYGAAVKEVLGYEDGIALLLDSRDQETYRVRHARSGDLVAVSAPHRWFSYSWWNDREKEPDFAPHIDIHKKPGYDPLELFLEPGTFRIAQDTSLVKGSHGYPAVSEKEHVPLLVSGEKSSDLQLPEAFACTDITALIETILSGERLEAPIGMHERLRGVRLRGCLDSEKEIAQGDGEAQSAPKRN